MPRTIKRKNKRVGPVGPKDGWLKAAPEGDIWAGYDPEKVKATLDRMAGSITPAEAERRIAEIYRAREEGTQPLDRR